MAGSPKQSKFPGPARGAYERIVDEHSHTASFWTPKKVLLLLLLICSFSYLIYDKPLVDDTCKPHELRPPTQYALMVDAGSTGSRIHVYKFSYCKGGLFPDLEDEIFEQIKPGLSSYDKDVEGASKSLDVLLDIAVKAIPEKLQGCTPIAVKATAGLRKLGVEKSENILKAVRERINSKYPFVIYDMQPNDGVSVMDGLDEGVYAWITVNYLNRKIGQSAKAPTSAIMDLGGGSTQIVFEPNGEIKTDATNNYKYELTFGSHKYTLYQHSYLGYGLMEGREKARMAAYNADGSELPCFSQDTSIDFTPDSTPDKNFVLRTLKGLMKGFETCKTFISQHLFGKSTCELSPCSFDGVYQPSLHSSFPVIEESKAGEIYAFSYFYDRTINYGLQESFSVGDIKSIGEKICKGDIKSITDEKVDYTCLDLSFIYGLLSVGYELPDSRTLTVKKKIQGYETGWCLGAAISMIDKLNQQGNIVCKRIP